MARLQAATFPRPSQGRFLVPLVFALTFSSGSVHAQATQEVRGNVIDGATGALVEGAMVLLFDADGQRVNGVLSGTSGFFRVDAPTPGRYRLRVERIGYANTETELFDVAAGTVTRQDVTTSVKPVELAQLDVSGSTRCQIRPEGVATAIVWEEARKALAAATWTEDREMYRLTWMLFEREVAANGRRILDETRTFNRGFTPTPFVAMDPDLLANEGFVETLPGGGARYYAPDATVLLSDPFLDTHCFRLRDREEEGERLLGLVFEPMSGRDLPDVGGVLWLEEESGRLRSLEYRYVNHPLRLPTNDGGGDLVFAELPNGTWIVREWRIRMPYPLQELDRQGRFRRWVINGYRDTGGVVQQATTNTGAIVMDVVRAGITGVVVDSAGRPVTGAPVRIQGTEAADTTAADGTFSFTDVGEGTWSVAAAMPELDGFGYLADIEVEVRQAGMVAARLELPSVRDVAHERCGATPPGPGRPVLLGRVADSAGAAVPEALVRVAWTSFQSQGVDLQVFSEWVDLRADDQGVFTFCEVEGRRIEVEAQLGRSSSPPVQVDVPRGASVVTTTVVLR